MKIYLTGVKKSGFSLMEMLIVVALFSTTVLIMAQTFASFNQLHRKIANRAIVSQELRFAMELLVRAARNNPVSFSPVPQPRDSQVRLDLSSTQQMIVRRSITGDPACSDLATVACLLLSTDSGTSWVPLTGKRINVEQFDVYVRPSASPFDLVAGSYPNNTQPFVTFNLRVKYMADNPKEQEALKTQTTVSSRVYKR